jgi:hypothetical protein
MITLVRKRSTLLGVTGEIWYKESFICHTLELPWNNNVRNLSCIPCDEYDIYPFWDGERESNRILIEPVWGRDDILIHTGNSLQDTTGCILAGSAIDYRHDEIWLSQSRIAMSKLLDYIQQFDVKRLKIISDDHEKYKVSGGVRGTIGQPLKPDLRVREVPKHKVNVNVPFWLQDGFKRGAAIAVTALGLAIKAFHPIGEAILYIGTILGGYGIIDATRKSKPEHNENKGFWQYLKEWFIYLINLISGRNKK